MCEPRKQFRQWNRPEGGSHHRAGNRPELGPISHENKILPSHGPELNRIKTQTVLGGERIFIIFLILYDTNKGLEWTDATEKS